MVIRRESDYNLRLVSGRAKDTAVFKFMIVFKHPNDSDRFENTCNDLLALIERIPDVRRRQVIHVVGSPQGASPYYRILEVYFDSSDALQTALLSTQGQEAGGELQKFPANSFEMVFAEVYEESGGSTSGA
jgi:uncharacterized protein (TIGR02118 family)